MLEQVTVAQKQLGYLVLARKYRPQKFSDLVGQEALVRTLQHAFSSGRIAHAFMLTGIRGVGKTTTARIIAKGLNCASTSEPTMEPCGQCGPCLGIAQGRHVDVLEMDAASRTGIDDIREILDSVAYKPVEARYKLYIIDEVHMLSKAAFNGLLKTLEEPPPHVKFLFATTEIKKVPVTVLSRCQRFDLRRIEVSEIASYLDHVCQKEQVDAEPHALKRLARASEGSMRDALSMLDQAIAHDGGQKLTASVVEAMLGLMDEGRKVDLLEDLLSGRIAEALHLHDELFRSGADPVSTIADLAGLVHELTRLKIDQEFPMEEKFPSDIAKKLLDIAAAMDIGVLVRLFDMLEKAFQHIQLSEQKKAALDMALIRIAYTSVQPTPGDVVRMIQENKSQAIDAQPKTKPEPQNETVSTQSLPNFEAIMAALDEQREVTLSREVMRYLRIEQCRDGYLEMGLADGAPKDIANRLKQFLHRYTGSNWVVSVVQSIKPTEQERQEHLKEQLRQRVVESPFARMLREHFPGAQLTDVKEIQQTQTPQTRRAADV